MHGITVQFLLIVSFFIFNVWNFPHHSHDHRKHCHTQSSNGTLIHIDVDQSVTIPGKCVKATCEKNLTVSTIQCVPVQVKSGCKETEVDYTKLYPDCCPAELCEILEENKQKR